MKNDHLSTRVLSLLLVLALLCGYAVPVHGTQAGSDDMQSLSFEQIDGVSPALNERTKAETTQEAPDYEDEEIVRTSIVLESKSTLDAGFSTLGIAENMEAMSYRDRLKAEQAAVTARIERTLGASLHVQWNLTLAANIISANMEYGKIEAIKSVPGVKDVVVEVRYEPCVVDREETADPNTATSSEMIGSSTAYAAGYTGNGSRVAIIDTGLDMDHQSFSAAAYEYSLSQLAQEAGMTLEAYMEQLHVLTVEEIEGVKDQLNAVEITPKVTAEELYKSSKVAFGYNYIDKAANYVDHNKDSQGGHGSHVAGIATANAYIPNEDGTFSPALDTAVVQGVAPDAQLLVMKIFGKNGGAYESDYIAAIEDAIILGCDSVNLSLGSSYPGYSRNTTYVEVMNSLVESDTVVVMSAGNSGHWADAAGTDKPGYLYADDISTHTGGSPGTYTNSLGVASVDNAGGTGYYIEVGGKKLVYAEEQLTNELMRTLAGEEEYIFIDGFGQEEDFAALGGALTGKIVMCSRGGCSFFEKANAAVKYGAIATIVYNNEPGVIRMDLTGYTGTAPCVSITQAAGAHVKAVSNPVTDEKGDVLYYTGKLEIGESMGAGMYGGEFYTVSSFSSYGVPGSLEMKPEISAPGGSIYSVDGETDGGKSYTTMSGTSMAAPQISGMAALVGQYIEENQLDTKTGLTQRALAQSLLMSTAEPLEETVGAYYPVLRQGAGLANVGAAIAASSYVMMHDDATDAYADGKVKVELKDDPEKKGVYEFGFTLNNLKDDTQKYMLSADFFTQGLISDDTYLYMDTATTELLTQITWTVNGVELKPATDVSKFDFNGDQVVNEEDVQAILDYAVGTRAELINPELADLDSSGEITTYDAYLLLDRLNTGLLTLEPNGKTEVKVQVAWTEAQKAELDASYENGAYIEGYVFAEQLSTEEGVLGTSHSIPVLGFYGNWTDASMYDRGTFISRLYGDTQPTYVASATQNSLTVRYPGSNDTYYVAGNPYLVESQYPAGREAISLDTTICQEKVTMIRNAAAVTILVKNQNGEYLYCGEPIIQDVGAFYSPNAGYWMRDAATYTLNQSPADLGAKEGDILTVSLVAIPELYEIDGDLTAEQIKSLMEQDILGDGVCLSNTFKVDSEAPKMVSVYKDLATGNLIVGTRDNNYTAIVRVLNQYGRLMAEAVASPEAEAGEVAYTTVDLSSVKDDIGPDCLIMIGDYAANSVVYQVPYGGEPIDYTGQMFGYTDGYNRGDGRRWMRITPENLWYHGTTEYDGTENLQGIDVDVTAAEYVGGYVYMAASDGYIYVAEQAGWGYYQVGGYFGDTTTGIRDMAFNYADQTLYALAEGNTIYSVDLHTCQLMEVVSITITTPSSGFYSNEDLTMLAIDDNGTFYLTNNGDNTDGYLYRFTLEQVDEGIITGLAPVVNEESANIGFYCKYGSMAWDHDKDILYMAGSNNASTSSYSAYLVKLNTETGKGEKATTNDGGASDDYYAAKLNDTVRGMYIVPAESVRVKPSTTATFIALDRTEVKALVGAEFTLNAAVYPWSLEDKTVAWSTTDETVATVADGVVSVVGTGTATITATTNAAPNLTATCTITSEKLANTALSALIYDAEGNAYWSDFETDRLAQWKPVSEKASSYYGGGLLEETIYVHDGTRMYGVDADLFETTDHGEIASSWIWSDAAPAPAVDDAFGQFLSLSYDGAVIAMINPENNSLAYWRLTEALNGDKMAAIAYVGTGTYDYYTYKNCPAHWYYVVTEAGDLWEIILFGYLVGENYVYNIQRTNLGGTSLSLPGVAGVTTGQYASMVYDQATGYLLLSAHTSGNTSRFYAIDPGSRIVAGIGDFGSNAAAVTSMYQYARVEELMVRMKTTAASLYVEDTLQLSASVVPAKYQNQVTWSSSNPEVAIVDENGNVTARKGGTAIITATSVDQNDAGEHATASCTVTVKDLTSFEGNVSAQVVTEEGTKWVSIDIATRAFTVDGDAATPLTGAGAHDGKIYGSNSDFTDEGNFFMIDPANGYEETTGSETSASYAALDMAASPTKTVTLTDYAGNHLERTVFGHPVFISRDNFFGFLTDYADGSISGWNWRYYYGNIGAVAYAGESTYELGLVYDTIVYYALAAHGTLYKFQIYATYSETAPNHVQYAATRETLGKVGVNFADYTKMTMTYVDDGTHTGLVVGYTGETAAELYYVDLETMTTGFIGRVPNATAITGLYSDTDLTLSTIPGTRVGNECVASTPVSIAQELVTSEVAVELSMVGDQTAGSVNTASAMSVSSENDRDAGKATVTIKADHEATNGLVTVEYDASKLTLEKIDVTADFKSVFQEAGKVTFGYVNAEAIARDAAIASLTFTVTGESAVTITTVEENDTTPDTSVTVKLSKTCHGGEDCPSAKFADVSSSAWYHEAIDYVVSHGLMCGISEDMFQPNGRVTRAQLITVLYRMADSPAVEGTVPFTDVQTGQFYSRALVWAYQNDIAKGITDMRFAPDAPVTREQMVTFFARYAQLNSEEMEAKGDLTDFVDASSVSSYAVEAMTWAVESGLIQGTSKDTLSPKSSSTRAQVAAILMRYCNAFG